MLHSHWVPYILGGAAIQEPKLDNTDQRVQSATEREGDRQEMSKEQQKWDGSVQLLTGKNK